MWRVDLWLYEIAQVCVVLSAFGLPAWLWLRGRSSSPTRTGSRTMVVTIVVAALIWVATTVAAFHALIFVGFTFAYLEGHGGSPRPGGEEAAYGLIVFVHLLLGSALNVGGRWVIRHKSGGESEARAVT